MNNKEIPEPPNEVPVEPIEDPIPLNPREPDFPATPEPNPATPKEPNSWLCFWLKELS